MICPSCHDERRSLHTEWRGFKLNRPMCPICANEAVKQPMRDAEMLERVRDANAR